MNILLDTNLLIRLEPTRPKDLEAGTRQCVEVMSLIQEGGHTALVHPASLDELNGDKDLQRREMREILVKKYVRLSEPPEVGLKITDTLGVPDPGTHDAVDFQLLAAVMGDAVDFLVTDDQRLLRRSVRVGLDERVLSPTDALGMLFALLPMKARDFPAVQAVLAHQLPSSDPIFDSLRESYDGFDTWLAKCKLEHRNCWRIEDEGALAAIAITKPEERPEHGLEGRALKICTFKVSDEFRGYRYGELLLKPVFDYAFKNGFRWIYVTVYEHQEQLIGMLVGFGFKVRNERTSIDELVMSKCLQPRETDVGDKDALDFHVRYGPMHIRIDSPVVIPIKDQFHQMLFPELHTQLDLFPSRAVYGNGIRKAYLCHSKLRRLAKGSTVLFYHSGGRAQIDAFGVVERVLVTSKAEEIVRFVGDRTIYSLEDIDRMCKRGDVLAILFRQALPRVRSLTLKQFRDKGLLKSHPQSIVSLPEEAESWLQNQMDRPS